MTDFLKKHIKIIIIAAAVIVCAVIALSLCMCNKSCNSGSSDSVISAEQADKSDLTLNTDGMTQEDGCYKLFLAIGDVYTLSATSKYSFSFTSTDQNVASVDGNGKITANNPGTCVIYVNAGTKVESVVVEVQNVVVPFVCVVKEEITLSLAIENANVYCLAPSVTYDGKRVECELTYTSTSSAIASVDENGVITAASAGECQIIITANYNGSSANCAVRVIVVND